MQKHVFSINSFSDHCHFALHMGGAAVVLASAVVVSDLAVSYGAVSTATAVGMVAYQSRRYRASLFQAYLPPRAATGADGGTLGALQDMADDIFRRMGKETAAKPVLVKMNMGADESPAYAGANGRIRLTEHFFNDYNPEQHQALLAHEIGHVKARHGWKRFALHAAIHSTSCLVAADAAIKMGAAIAVGAESHDLGYHVFGRMVAAGAVAYVAPYVLASFDRVQEYHADRLAAAVVGPQQMEHLLERFEVLHGKDDAAEAELGLCDRLLASHPSVPQRMVRVKAMTPV